MQCSALVSGQREVYSSHTILLLVAINSIGHVELESAQPY